MKQQGFKAKVVFTLLATLVLLCAMCSFAMAADVYENLGCSYGQAVPTDKNYEDEITNYTFYGDEATLHIMQISKGKKNAYYAVEIYTDKNCTDRIRTLNMEFPKESGRSKISISWPFKETESGTYYGKCYSYTKKTVDGEETKIIDSNSITTFTIKINRVGKKTVKLNGISNVAKGVKVSWEKMPTAVSYRVYRKGPNEKKWSLIGTTKGTSSYFIDKTAKSGKKYTYTVKCKDNKYTSKYNTKGLSIKYVAMPTPSVKAVGTAGYAKLSWTKVSGAEGYYVYRKGGSLSNYTWEKIATIKNPKTLSYTDKKAKNTGWAYTYTVKAYNGKATSGYLATGVDFNFMKAPTLKKVSNYEGGLKITWSCSDADATSFIVYRKNGKNWKKIGTTENKYFVDRNATAGSKNTYTVKAVSATNNSGYSDKGLGEKYIPTPIPQKPVFNNKYHATVKWNSVKGATGYVVYRKVGETGNWKKLATVKGKDTTSYVDKTNKSSNKAYTYTIRACDKSGLLSSYSKTGATTVCLVMPVVKLNQVATTDSSLQIEISWKAIKGAEKYRIYRCIDGGSYKAIKTTTETSFIDTENLLHNTDYKYVVRAIHENGDMSAYRPGKILTPLLFPTITSIVASPEDGTEITWESVSASSYNVYRRAADSNKWEKVKTTENTAYTDKAEEAKGNKFYYAVSANFGKKESIKSEALANFIELTVDSGCVENERGEFALHVYWSCPEGSRITIMRSVVQEDGSVDFETIITNAPGNDFEDTTAEKGVNYVYKVIAETDGKLTTQEVTSCKRSYDRLDASDITVAPSAEAADNTATFNISWSAVEFAEEYIVMRSEDNENWVEATRVNATETTSYKDPALELEKTYYYKVIALNETEGRPESVSGVAEGIAYAPVGLFSVTSAPVAGTKHIKIEWDLPDYAEGYRVYRKLAETTEWVKIHEITDKLTSSYTDNRIEYTGSYVYKIEAYAENRDPSSNTTESTPIPVEINAPEISITASENAYTVISWDSVGAASYTIERALKANGEWEKLATVEDVASYTDESEGAMGAKFYYRVTATFGNRELPSEAKANFVELTFSVQQDAQNGIKLVFSSSTEGATTSVERQTGDGEFQLIALDSHPVNKLVSYDKNTESGVTYTYKLIGKANSLLDNEICKTITRK